MKEHLLYVIWWILALFDQGKDLEVRPETRRTAQVKKGDTVIFNNHVRRRVNDIRIYPNFETVLRRENALRIVPGKTAEEILAGLRKMYPNNQRRILVFELTRTE